MFEKTFALYGFRLRGLLAIIVGLMSFGKAASAGEVHLLPVNLEESICSIHRILKSLPNPIGLTINVAYGRELLPIITE